MKLFVASFLFLWNISLQRVHDPPHPPSILLHKAPQRDLVGTCYQVCRKLIGEQKFFNSGQSSRSPRCRPAPPSLAVPPGGRPGAPRNCFRPPPGLCIFICAFVLGYLYFCICVSVFTLLFLLEKGRCLLTKWKSGWFGLSFGNSLWHLNGGD